MIKFFKISGLDCPNCVKKLEEKLSKIDGVNSIKIDFLKNELKLDFENDIAEKQVLKLAKEVEPDIVIEELDCHANNHDICCGHECDCCSCKTEHKSRLGLILFFIGSISGIGALFAESYSKVLFYILLVLSSVLIGYKTFFKAYKLLTKGNINENLLVTISVIGAILVGKGMEALMVIFLYTIGKYLEGVALDKSRKSIEKLINFRPEFARVVSDDGKEKVCKPNMVKIGEILLVKPGERVPLDGIVIEGKANLNTQSLTGESLPDLAEENDKILSGSIVLDGVLKIKVTSLYKDSCVNKILHLIEEASEKKSKTETFVSKIAKWYTLGVMISAVLVFGIVLIATGNFNVSIYRGLIFLVVSCPCAFAISVPLSYFSGLGRASKSGILIKGSNFVDLCTKMKTIGFDKTGTITTGKFEIKDIIVLDKRYKKEDILYLASLGEQHSLHPLAKCIVEKNKLPLAQVQDFREKIGSGVSFKYNNDLYFIGNKNTSDSEYTLVSLYKNEVMIGEIVFEDKIKDNIKNTIQKLKAMGIETIIISGDKENVVKRVAKEAGFDKYYFGLLPQEKFGLIKKICESNSKGKFAFVGDGLNDAPALNLSDIGFCMGISGNEASLEGSDVVIVDDDISKIVDCIKISKFTRKIVLENIFGSALVKSTFLILGAIGITGMLGAVIADVGLTMLAIANSLRVLWIKN